MLELTSAELSPTLVLCARAALRRGGLAALLVLATAATAWATHNRAGEIRVEQTGALSVRATLTTYTAFEGPSADADRDSLLFVWGDGSSSWVVRSNGDPNPDGIPEGERIGDNIQLNVYVADHAYSGRGQYTVSVSDKNRVAGIINVPQSVEEEFYVETVFTFLDANFQGPNSTPRLLQPPIDEGCIGEPFVHNPNAFDPDGDSLAYRLGRPAGTGGLIIDGYRFPSDFGTAGGTSNFRLDEVTGTLLWDRPRQAGDYNVVILVISYRAGFPIDTTVRDMQINITTCDNRPPEIEVAREFCLVAGDTLTLDPVATAPLADSNQRVRLQVTAAALDFPRSPATWTGNGRFNVQPYTARFTWPTVCEHVERFPYNVIFRATDDFQQAPDTVGLSWLEVVRVRVSAPPPEGLAVRAADGLIELDWDAPYACEDAAEDFFYGFSVWRREGSNPFPYDSCRQGLAGAGYTRLTRRTEELAGGRYVFSDDDVERGRTYCYRVLGQFVRYTGTGRPFNLVESIPSVEVCVQSSRDLPLLTRADVLATSPTDGRVDVRWVPPVVEDLDTVANPAPYTYALLRSPGIGTSDFQVLPGTERAYSSFAALARDTQFVDAGLDTESRGYTYAVRFETSRGTGVPPLPASTVFLRVTSTDEVNELTWDAETSWENVRYAVLRERPGGGEDTVARVRDPRFRDVGLTNGEEFCYRVVAFGTYGVDDIPDPLVNHSQRACGVPLDTLAPCVPRVAVRTICDDPTGLEVGDEEFVNELSWAFDADCPAAADLAAVRVYTVADSSGADRTLVSEVAAPRDSLYFDAGRTQVAACYAITALDSLGNESALSPLTCVSNCPLYVLPNTFTPNGDNANDVLLPRRSRLVERVEFVLYDRWGVRVFETEDPDLRWDGRRVDGSEAPTGTYFYSCAVFQREPGGEVVPVGEAPLEGFVELFR